MLCFVSGTGGSKPESAEETCSEKVADVTAGYVTTQEVSNKHTAVCLVFLLQISKVYQ